MERKRLRTFDANKVFFILMSILIAFTASCLNDKGRTEVTGFPRSFAELAKMVKPAVVNVSTTSTVRVPGNPFRQFFGPHDEPFGDFFGKFFGDIPDREMKQRSLGSGFIVDKSGYIITNNHVVAGADEIKVKLADGREYTAKVVGRDKKTDLALIKISSIFKDLPTLALGDSDSMQVGDWVLAIGNPFGLEHTVTQGIISASGRVIGSGPYDNFLQTDAPINPGNSGGPLVNLKGEVIGINTAIVAAGQGIGFAIPSNTAKTVITQLREKGKVIRGWLGVSIQMVTSDLAESFGMKEPQGALVADVVPGSPAEKAGIKQGDIILSFDGKKINTSSDLPWIVADTPVGKTINVKLIRQGKEMDIKVTVVEMTEQRTASQMGTPSQSLGLAVDNIKPQWRKQFNIKAQSGVVVIRVAPDSPADDAGIEPGDVIREVNKKVIRNLSDFKKAVAQIKEDEAVVFLMNRGNQSFYISMKIS
ncbi:MAG TPA: DegQ family serine endoprotease [Syntrophales bacterium]|nr:DegQ family serine endoprotease [Syntrophales bacterium]